MHYSPYAFTKNGWQTIIPLRNVAYANRVMGQRDGFSDTDIVKLNQMYDCPVGVDVDVVDVSAAATATTTRRPTTTTPTPESVTDGGKCVDGAKCWIRKWIYKCTNERFERECPRYCDACGKYFPVTTTTTTTATTMTTTERAPSLLSTTARPDGVGGRRRQCRDTNANCAEWATFCNREYIYAQCSIK